MICARCGNECERRGTKQKYCVECRKIVRKEYNRTYIRRGDRKKENVLKNVGLDEVIARASAAGMSYGQYVARMEMCGR